MMAVLDAHTADKFVDMNVKDKLARIANLPPLPILMLEALQFGSSNQNVSNLADMICQDPPMTVRLLRIANSPFYGMSREISSLREAVVLLGLNRVREMLLGVGFLKTFPVNHQDFDYVLFWHHSMAVAECAKHLAMHVGMDQDVAFTAGLLHDIGLLAIVLLFPKQFSQIISLQDSSRIAAERQILGLNHIEIGVEVAKYWNLPICLQQAIAQHETLLPQTDKPTLGMLIYTSNLLVAVKENEEFPETNQYAIDQALERLNLSIDQATGCAEMGCQFAEKILECN